MHVVGHALPHGSPHWKTERSLPHLDCRILLVINGMRQRAGSQSSSSPCALATTFLASGSLGRRRFDLSSSTAASSGSASSASSGSASAVAIPSLVLRMQARCQNGGTMLRVLHLSLQFRIQRLPFFFLFLTSFCFCSLRCLCRFCLCFLDISNTPSAHRRWQDDSDCHPNTE